MDIYLDSESYFNMISVNMCILSCEGKNGIECIAFVVLLLWHLHSYPLLLTYSLILPFQQHKLSFPNSLVAGVLSTTNRQVINYSIDGNTLLWLFE